MSTDSVSSSVDPDQFRLAMGRFATGVTVLTTRSGEHDHAMTANAITSVSIDPLLVLVCVEVDARFHDAVTEAGIWGVSILGADQRPVAQWLSTQGQAAARPAGPDRAPPRRGHRRGPARRGDGDDRVPNH